MIMPITEYIPNDDDCYTDYDFYLEPAPDGWDWNCHMFFDKETKQWSTPAYRKSKSKDDPFDDTDDAPPSELVAYVLAFLEEKRAKVLTELTTEGYQHGGI